MKFERYHALGNDYLVMDPQVQPSHARAGLSDAEVIRICHRHFGVGSDGILWGNLTNAAGSGQAFGLRILNPDASEAEKSGNGLRIFCRYLYDTQQVGDAPFEVWTLGGVVQAQILQQGKQVRVAVGQARFVRSVLPMRVTQAGQSAEDEVLAEAFQLPNERLHICVANVGNPHCVVLREAGDTFDAETVHSPIAPMCSC
jgi:diaminopimelate epimerase